MREGLDTMMEEVEHLAGREVQQVVPGRGPEVPGERPRPPGVGLEVALFGGAMLLPTDDYARNAQALLRALQVNKGLTSWVKWKNHQKCLSLSVTNMLTSYVIIM